jgi:hypothetical protein
MVTRPSIPRTAWQRIFGLLAAAAVGLCVAVPPPAAQQVPNPTKEDLANDNKLFITLARKALKWDEPTAPSKIVGPLQRRRPILASTPIAGGRTTSTKCCARTSSSAPTPSGSTTSRSAIETRARACKLG